MLPTIIRGTASTLGAIAIAIVALFKHRLFSFAAMQASINALRQLHSGHVGNYVTWLVLGFSTLGILLGMLL